MNKRPKIPTEFSDKGPDDPKNTIGAKRARAAQARPLRPINEAQRMTNARPGTHAFKPMEHQVHEAPPEVRRSRFFTCVSALSILVLALAIIAILILLSKLPAAVTALQTRAATYATLPTLTPTTTPSLTFTPTYTFTPTPTPTLTPTPRATITPSATPTTTPTPRPTSTQNYTATLQAAQAAQQATQVLATVTAMWWTATPTAMPAVILAPDEDTPPTADSGAFLTQIGLILFCVIAVARLFRWMRGGEEEITDVYTDDTAVKLHRAVQKPIERRAVRKGQQNARRAFVKLVLELGDRDDLAVNQRYGARRIGDLLGINKDTMAALTNWMMENGALMLRNADSPQSGYMRRLNEDGHEMTPAEIIARLPAFTPPPPGGVLPDYRVPSDRQTHTDSSRQSRQTVQDSSLVFGEDGKPIFK